MTKLMDERVELLFDTLTTYDCESRYDIVALTNLPVGTIDGVLKHIRQPDVAADWGWTVPHVPRGTGVHLFQVVEASGGTHLDDDESRHVQDGAVSTLRVMASHGENEGNAVRIAAQYVTDPALRRLLVQTVKAAEGAAAMARQAADALAQ